MLHLEGSGLKVHLLHPVEERARLGSRYVTGGFIWQVEDAAQGDLFSGPIYPRPNPNGWDGQGAPEVFEIALGQHRARVGEDVGVIGVGQVKRESPVKPFHVRNNFTVTKWLDWSIEPGPQSLTFTARQAFQEWSLDLVRTVRLKGRILESATLVRNTGGVELPIRWFAHPFFPHAGLECFGFDRESVFPFWVADAGGFRYNDRGWIERKAGHDWKQGCYQLVQIPFGYPLTAEVRHPKLGGIKVEADFPLTFLPIWANENTFSFEPYLQTQVLPGISYSWAMRYHL
jgi:hypothetical protein